MTNKLKFGREIKMKGEYVGDFIAGIVVFVATMAFGFVIALFFGWVVMLLWNWLIPVIFGLTTITYWQGVGLLWLTGMLFKGSNTVQSKS